MTAFDYFIKVSLVIHVTAGTLALITGLLAMILKSQTPKHKRVGKIYFWCMTVIFVTGFYLSLIRGNLFLFYISIFSYYLTLVAYRALKYKDPAKRAERMDWLIELVSGGAFLGLVIYAVISFIYPEGRMSGLIPLAFGLIGLSGVRRNTARFRSGPSERLSWQKLHIGNMIGSYIAAVTAFLVNQSEYIPVNPVILWLGPTVLLVPLIRSEVRKVKTIPLKK